jgi:hypothetical protein
VRYLAPYLEDGRLRIDVLQNLEPVDLVQLPRVATGLGVGARGWFSLLPSAPLLEDLTPEPVYRGTLCDSVAEVIAREIGRADPIAADAFRPALPVERWEVKEGDVRDPALWFSPVKGASISRIVVKDPYCGAGQRQMTALVDLLRWVTGAAREVSRLAVHAREQHQRDANYRPKHQVQRELTSVLREIHRGGLAVLVQEFAKSRAFHDRTIEIAVIDADGCEVEYRYDLTGGIDYLLDPKKATKVFCYRVES